jgi:23S rRNA (adenine2030-N6)-methyltransferase
MKYRHAHHAGNFADVVKHLTLLEILRALVRKPAAFFVLDTHAGRGAYELPPDSEPNPEYRSGIGRLLDPATEIPCLSGYLTLVRQLGGTRGDPAGLRSYPGSPLIIASQLREQDRAAFFELNEPEAAVLKRRLHAYRNAGVHCADGYAAVRSHLPPPERRGLVLIDPPYEAQQGEFARVEQAVHEGYRRWTTGIFAIWYPIKRRAAIGHFHSRLKATGIRKILCAELCLYPDDSRVSLNGCGMVIVNPPYQLQSALDEALPALHAVLGAKPGTPAGCFWLVPE